VEFRILGPLEVLDDGRELPLGPAKERAVLAVLLLHAGSVVSRAQLIDGLWGESPPQTAAKAVNVYVSQVRRTLSRNGDEPIVTRPPGYVVDPGDEALDATQFQLLGAAARERAHAGELEVAAALMREALGLWRGPALAGLELEGSARDDVARLEDLRLTAELDLVDYRLALGDHEQLVPELERRVARHPLDERVRAQLILGLYRSGRQADALNAYRETRETLVNQLGIEPSAPLQRLERAILNHDPSLEAPTGVTRRGDDSREEAALSRAARRPQRSRRAIAPLAILLLAAGSVAAVVGWHRPTTPAAASHAPPHSLVAIDPGTGAQTRIPMDWTPSALALGGNTVWALDRADQVVALVDLRSRRIEQVAGLGVAPVSASVGAGDVWVLDSEHGVVLQLDPASGTVRSTTNVPLGDGSDTSVSNPTGIATGAHSVWIEDGAALVRLDPDTRKVTKRLVLDGQIGGVAVGAGSVWAIQGSPATLVHIDSRTGRIKARIPIARGNRSTEPFPIGLAVGAGAVWVLNGNTGTVTRVDPDLDAVVATVSRVSMNPTRIVAAAHAVWVGDGAQDSLLQIDPTSDRVVRTIQLEGKPKALVAGRSRVWVAVDST
jgi:DNA-binding SARP family transcriptional activator/streptogramin lyase